MSQGVAVARGQLEPDSQDGGGNVRYYCSDALGSSRIITNATGAVCYDSDFYAFGTENNSVSNGCPSNWTAQNYKFTGQERDSETGNDHYWARYFGVTQSRWMSPDPMGGDPTNPQSLNRYACVLNNPLSLVDPLGLSGDDGCTWDGKTLTCPAPPPVQPGSSVGSSPGGGGCVGVVLSGIDEGNCASGGSAGGGVIHGGSAGSVSSGGKSWVNFFGIRAQDQTFNQCMQQNANTYSIGGALELAANVATGTNTSISSYTSPVTGNNINTFFFGSTTSASASMAANVPSVVSTAMGSPLTYGRRTTSIMSLNLNGVPGGPPLALSQASKGAQSLLGKVGNALNLGMDFTTKLGIDAAFTTAEAVGCSIYR